MQTLRSPSSPITEADCNEYIALLTSEIAEGATQNRALALKSLPHFSRAKTAVLNGAPRTARRMLEKAAELLLAETPL